MRNTKSSKETKCCQVFVLSQLQPSFHISWYRCCLWSMTTLDGSTIWRLRGLDWWLLVQALMLHVCKTKHFSSKWDKSTSMSSLMTKSSTLTSKLDQWSSINSDLQLKISTQMTALCQLYRKRIIWSTSSTTISSSSSHRATHQLRVFPRSLITTVKLPQISSHGISSTLPGAT